MAALGDGVTVRLGPGTFPTKGERGWTVKNGLRVIGSGMFVTFLKLVIASPTADQQYHVVGSSAPPAKNGFELSDLTIDCNLAGQPDTGAGFPQIMAGGVDLRGPNMVIRRVRVINFGTNTKSWECFGIGIGYAAASDTPVASNCVIEDCVIERPALANARETTCLNLSAYEDALLRAAYHEDCAIRNCFINCEYVRSSDAKPALKVSSLTRSGTTATLTTIEPHGRVPGDWILVSGATDPFSADFYARIGQTALFNGSFKVTHVSEDGLSLNYTMDDAPASPSAGGEVWLGKAPSAQIPLENIVRELVGGYYYVTLTTAAPHNLFLGTEGAAAVKGDRVLVSLIKTNPGGVDNLYNGYYEALEVAGASYPSRMFKYKVGATDPGTLATDAAAQSVVGAPFQGLSGDGGRRAVVEGNRIYNCRVGGPYHDFYSTESLIVRKNYYYNVNTGVYQNLGTKSLYELEGNLAKSESVFTFTFINQAQNPFAIGEVVFISNTPDPDQLSGSYEVTDKGADWFKFIKQTNQGPNPESVYKVKRVFGVQRIMIVDNVMELALFAPGTQSHAAPSGVTMIAPTDFSGLPIIRDALVRGNLIRHMGGISDPCARGDSRGIDVSCCKSLIVESNVIGVESSDAAIKAYACGAVKALNNQDFSGKPVSALKWDVNPHQHIPEIRTQAEDLFLTFL